MTKEEIVRQEYEKMFSTQKYDKSVNRRMNFKYFSPAMDQYAKQQAVKFANWITDSGYIETSIDQWTDYGKGKDAITTEELYSLFTTNI